METIIIAVNPNWCQLFSSQFANFKDFRATFSSVMNVERSPPDDFEMVFWDLGSVGCWFPSRLCWSSQFVGLLFAPATPLPCACSSDRGWCGVGTPGRKYKLLSFRCLADKSCGGPAAPRFRHVPPTPQWGLFCWDPRFNRGKGIVVHWHGQHPDVLQLIKGVAGWWVCWLVGWLNGFVTTSLESFATAWATQVFGREPSMRSDWVWPARRSLLAPLTTEPEQLVCVGSRESRNWNGSRHQQPASHKPDGVLSAEVREDLCSVDPSFPLLLP